MKENNLQKKIRVGFDFDGVIFYNFTKIFRPFVYIVKKYLFGIEKTKFYIPKNSFLQKIGYALHRTSYKPNIGFQRFLNLTKNPKYEVYVITARPSFMKNNIYDELKPYDIKGVKKIIQNKQDAQPHIYKEKLVNELKLDYFVEDNWDIVEHLNKTTKAKTIWIYNLADNLFINYKLKAKDLNEAIKFIK